MLKQSRKFDFYTESSIVFPYKLQEFIVKLGISGNLIKTETGKLSVPVNYDILSIKLNGKTVKCSEDLKSNIFKYIKNNPNRMREIVMVELGSMILFVGGNKNPLTTNTQKGKV